MAHGDDDVRGWGSGIYVVISRNRAFTAPKSESPIRRYRAEAALNGPVRDRRARPSCDGSERFGSGTQAYGQI
jgi:hypothetical protein